ncbi:MAG TPA: hypothetical protein VJR89_03695, partial [Polyangiales bacterium]|nr:hypothetical protein [Polyangiales bacterium]
EARVVSVEPGYAVIDMGSLHGVTAGDHVAFEQVREDHVDRDHIAQRRERVAVGTAVSIGETRTRVELGVGERVEIGTYGHPTREAVSARTFTPPRLGGVWHAGFMVRPFLVVDNFGFGAAFELRAGRRFDIPFHLEAVVQPFAVGTGREGAVVSGSGALLASFDSKLFEVGLGVGMQSVNMPAFDLPAGTGTTLAQRLRIGSVDGGNLELISYVVLFHQEFEFSSLYFHGQLPVGERSWLVLNASGGSVGMGFGELGLKVMLTGNGDIGSFLLTASIGAVNVFKDEFCEAESSNCSTVDYWGPMAGFGSEWRF